jgi:hypothetical protein
MFAHERTHTHTHTHTLNAKPSHIHTTATHCSFRSLSVLTRLAQQYGITPKAVRDVWNQRTWVSGTKKKAANLRSLCCVYIYAWVVVSGGLLIGVGGWMGSGVQVYIGTPFHISADITLSHINVFHHLYYLYYIYYLYCLYYVSRVLLVLRVSY